MKKFYALFFYFFVTLITEILPQAAFSQVCANLTRSYSAKESRCAATGTLQINVSGGSGSYQYKVTGPVSTSYTSVSLITGLSAGSYLVTIKDIVANCVYNNDSITIAGNYLAPGFTLAPTGVTCINGNDGKITATGLTNGRAPFSYKIIAPSAMGVGTISTTGIFTGLVSGNYLIQLRDSCGAIQTRNVTVDNYNWSINFYNFSKIGCDSILFTLNLTDSRGNVTPSTVFNGFMYGASTIPGDTTWFTTNTFTLYKGKKRNVYLFVKDACGNIKSVIWTDNDIPGVNATVSISNKVCATFRAKITGQVSLTNPSYCIYNSSNVLLSCNTTGTFTLLPYGSYCIKITDACYDTAITRCFMVAKPVPSVDVTVDIVKTCTSFTATITGQTNTINPNYCLYDAGNVLITCNTTGVFADLPFGTYCIKVANSPICYDTTITRCFTVKRPIPSVGPIVDISNLSCSNFTASITDAADWDNPQFCIYTPAHVLIICNTTGVFDSLAYGTYCIEIKNNTACFDTTIIRCFTVAKPIPSADDWVTISNQTCTGFTAEITGQTNISNAGYCLYNSLNKLVACNTTGLFNNIPYGSYCIKIKNNPACYDTIIERCFTETVAPVYISVSAKKSCAAIGTTDIKVTFDSGNPAYTVSLFSPAGMLLRSAVTSAAGYTFLSVPNLVSPQKYKIVVTDLCGNKDSALILPKVNTLSRVITIAPKCPSGAWPNGSGDVVVNLSANNIGGNITPKIIKKDGAVVAIGPTLATPYNYTFLNLGPGTYIFDTYVQTCNLHFYDTVLVRIYLYPILSGSNAYQCDNNGFSVNVNVQGGVAPYTYEIIGSSPALPGIITAPQASPVFTINNGTTYSLIRLRVVDGCGNASLYDVSVLPLANFIVTANSAECFNSNLTLRVDSIANAVYTWYKRKIPNDSVIVGTGPTYFIPNLLSSDTGRYFCRVVVNNGCLIKQANYVVRGSCYVILPNDAVMLAGHKQNGYNYLSWNNAAGNIKSYSLQRSQTNNSDYQTINSLANNGALSYSFTDKNPFNGNNYYRLQLTGTDNSIKYSNTVLTKNEKFSISFYPNPVNSMLYISIENNTTKNYAIEINNMLGQRVMIKTFYKIQNAVINCARDKAVTPGVYVAIITDLDTSEKQTAKLIYK